MREQTGTVIFSDKALIPNNDPDYKKNPPKFFDNLRGIPRKLKFYQFVRAPIPAYSHDKIGSPAPSQLNSRGTSLLLSDFLKRIRFFLFNRYYEVGAGESSIWVNNFLLSQAPIVCRLKLEPTELNNNPERRNALLALLSCFDTISNDTTYNLITRILDLLSHPMLEPEKKPEFRAFLSFLVGVPGVMEESDYYSYFNAFKEAWEDALFVARVLYQMDNGQIASEDEQSIFSSKIYSLFRKDVMLTHSGDNEAQASCSTGFFGLPRRERSAISHVADLHRKKQSPVARVSASPNTADDLKTPPFFHNLIPHAYYPIMGYSTANAAVCYRLGTRPQQEDVCLLGDLPADRFEFLDMDEKQEIAKILWTAFAEIDRQIREEEVGTTACVTIYDGKNFLYTAAVGDSVTFAVVYNTQGEPLAVHRLNTLHKLNNEKERVRIGEENIEYSGRVERVGGAVIMTRALGDKKYKRENNLTAAPNITVHDLRKLKENSGENSSYIELVTTSDGFTDGAGIIHTALADETQEQQEAYLLYWLRIFATNNQQMIGASTSSAPAESSPLLKAKFLAATAEKNVNDTGGISDNICVSVSQIITEQPLLAAVFDGHGGFNVSRQVASQMGDTLRDLFEASESKRQDLFLGATQYYNTHSSRPTQFEQEYRPDSQEHSPHLSCSSSI
jgi:integrin-linked kinase-associated serine/threonine phosphatase 2C